MKKRLLFLLTLVLMLSFTINSFALTSYSTKEKDGVTTYYVNDIQTTKEEYEAYQVYESSGRKDFVEMGYTFMTFEEAKQNFLNVRAGKPFVQNIFVKFTDKPLLDLYSSYRPYSTVGSLADVVYLFGCSSQTHIRDYWGYTIETYYDMYDATPERLAPVYAKLSSVVAGATGSTYDKIKYIHDYICENANYSVDLSKHGAYENVINKSSLCSGFAFSFYICMDMLGIESYIVTGDVSPGAYHGWNIVKLDGAYYYVDTTDDGGDDNTYYNYFLVGTDYRNQFGPYPISATSYNSLPSDARNKSQSTLIPMPSFNQTSNNSGSVVVSDNKAVDNSISLPVETEAVTEVSEVESSSLLETKSDGVNQVSKVDKTTVAFVNNNLDSGNVETNSSSLPKALLIGLCIIGVIAICVVGLFLKFTLDRLTRKKILEAQKRDDIKDSQIDFK